MKIDKIIVKKWTTGIILALMFIWMGLGIFFYQKKYGDFMKLALDSKEYTNLYAYFLVLLIGLAMLLFLVVFLVAGISRKAPLLDIVFPAVGSIPLFFISMIGAARSFHGDAGFFFNAVIDTVDVVADVFYRFMKNVISVWNPGIAMVRIVVALLIAGGLMLIYGVFKGGGKITVIAYSLVWFLASFLGCTLTSLFGSIIWHDHSVNMFYATLIGAVLSVVGVGLAGKFIENAGEDEDKVDFFYFLDEKKPEKEKDEICINIPEKIKARIAFFTNKRNIPSIAVGAVGFVCFLVSLLSGKLTLYAELRNKACGIEYKEIASAGIDISTASILTSMQLVVSGWVIYGLSAAEGLLKRKLNVRLSVVITALFSTATQALIPQKLGSFILEHLNTASSASFDTVSDKVTSGFGVILFPFAWLLQRFLPWDTETMKGPKFYIAILILAVIFLAILAVTLLLCVLIPAVMIIVIGSAVMSYMVQFFVYFYSYFADTLFKGIGAGLSWLIGSWIFSLLVNYFIARVARSINYTKRPHVFEKTLDFIKDLLHIPY
ncbi:MAG: hypothetical protein K5796_08150 [Lachnospiraceae bacterium]|nr:hypothetical protein [Lachnospiraceae bacterium]